MANGQVVLVTTEPLDGGPPVRSVYFVAEGDPERAAAIVAAVMAPNERVEAWGSLPEVAVKALKLKPVTSRTGEWKQLTAKILGLCLGPPTRSERREF
jgi:hypothetical protein